MSLFCNTLLFAQNQKTDTVASPQLQLCWQIANTELTAIKPLVQNDKLFLPLAGGNLLAINTATGETLWRTELGGEIIGQLVAGENTVFVPTQINSEKQNLIVVRALSAATGVTVWQGELPQTSDVWLALRENVLLAATSLKDKNELKINGLSAADGELRWSQTIAAQISQPPAIAGNSFYLATADKTFRVHSLIDGAEQRKLNLPQEINGNFLLISNVLIISDRAGNVAAVRLANGETLWKLRVGGAIQQILPTSNGILLSSLDDFIYFHDLQNGKRRWRRRLASRPLGATATALDNSVLLTVTGETIGTLLNLKKGKIVGQLSFGANSPVVFAPFRTAENNLVITTQGVSAYALACRPK